MAVYYGFCCFLSSLSDIQFENIFSHSFSSCLFALLIISSAFQKLLSLIWSYRSLFAFVAYSLGIYETRAFKTPGFSRMCWNCTLWIPACLEDSLGMKGQWNFCPIFNHPALFQNFWLIAVSNSIDIKVHFESSMTPLFLVSEARKVWPSPFFERLM